MFLWPAVPQAGTSNGCADPIMTGFGGRSFNFLGEADKIYNLISSKDHQMSAKLQFAQMWDHNGTTMSVRTSMPVLACTQVWRLPSSPLLPLWTFLSTHA